MADPGIALATSDVASGTALPWAVIGAGAHGLAALKALLQHGVPAEGLERSADVGGLWNGAGANARGYDSLHMVSTKPFSQFPDFPMPPRYPDYPSVAQAQEYLQRYARHFGLMDRIQFGSEVLALDPLADAVDVTSRDTVTGTVSTRRYGGVVIANGHQGKPYLPDIPGLKEFPGQVLHAADYRSSEELRGRRVLVVGGGDSGCDIAVDAGLVAAGVLHSTRRGLRLTPRYALGRPVDQITDLLLALRVPQVVRRAVLEGLRRIVLGVGGDPAGRTAVNQLLPTLVGHGRVTPKPEVAGFDAGAAVFTDGTRDEVDAVVLATGYRPDIPFADDALLNCTDGVPQLAHGIFTPTHPAVVVAGLIDSDAGQWPLAHWQGMLVARYAQARRDHPGSAQEFLARLVAATEGSPMAVEHQRYLATVEADIQRLEGSR